MKPEHQVYGGGDYTPSKRAAKAANAGQSGSGPVVGDGPKASGGYSSNTSKQGGDMPKQRNEAPANQGLNGSDTLGNTRSVSER